MRPIRFTIIAFLLIFCQLSLSSFGQLGISFDIKKPKEYEDRVLRSEKSDQKKFNLPRRFIQNTVTHYNYYFNANNKLNNVLERAKASFIDDYSKLLPFYNYTLDATARDSIQLDSIAYKSTTGIVLHDLRNDWMDNLYLLWGTSYYLKKQFDSAYLMYQFINYAFADKEKDGYYKAIGSSMDGNKAFSIATKEKTSLPRKLFTEPPSRNDAFIWQIRNFLAQDEFTEAASLIVTLRNDPNFPRRLQDDLQEVQAYWFYKQNMWDSAVIHLVKSLDNATNKQERARWEYLAAQLYELTGHYKESEKYFSKAITHTTDPIMDVYARLFSIRVNRDSSDDRNIEKNIAELVKMARHDKYEEYRDIIYYMAAQMQLERKDLDGAKTLLLKSTQVNSNNLAQRNKAFLQLAEISFTQRQYRQAYNFYDSIHISDPSIKDPEAITKRKDLLGRIASNIEMIERQDSLQRIALMPEDERKAFINKLVKQLRKQQGLKAENNDFTTGSPFPQSSNNNNNTLFPPADTRGEWYFYNTSLRSRGSDDFKSQWGNRPNVDNWRRGTTIAGTIAQSNVSNNPTNTSAKDGNGKDNGNGLTYNSLLSKIPLTADQMKKSNDSIQSAMFSLGKLYIQDIEDCGAGTETLEKLRSRFPDYSRMDEVLFNLYYCYNKNGEKDKADAIRKIMADKFPKNNFTTIVTTGKNPETTHNTEATKAYEKIYDLFIEGSFEEALAQKKVADSLYGKNYWTPQLLYIESVYYIKQRNDSTAKNILSLIVAQFRNTPIGARSATLLDVLNRRKQIEDELSKVVIKERASDTAANKHIYWVPPPKDTSSLAKNTTPVVNNTKQPIPDSLNKKNAPVKNITTSYTFSADAAYYVVIILNKVDPVFSNEAKNAFFRYNRETYYNKIMTAEMADIDADNKLVLIGSFKNAQEALDYVNAARPRTATEIIPWLKGGKYSFSIITDKNLELLKTSKDIDNYKAFLDQHMPGKF